MNSNVLPSTLQSEAQINARISEIRARMRYIDEVLEANPLNAVANADYKYQSALLQSFENALI
jgi:hypothetical protein